MAARYRGVVTNMQIGAIMGIHQPGGRLAGAVGQVLGEIVDDETVNGRPMLSAIVVDAKGKPGAGFFGKAKELGQLAASASPEEQMQFWQDTRESVYEIWGKAFKLREGG
jgi:hypothetical protein